MSEQLFYKPQIINKNIYTHINYKIISKKEYLQFNKNDFDYINLKQSHNDFNDSKPFCLEKKSDQISKRISHIFL